MNDEVSVNFVKKPEFIRLDLTFKSGFERTICVEVEEGTTKEEIAKQFCDVMHKTTGVSFIDFDTKQQTYVNFESVVFAEVVP